MKKTDIDLEALTDLKGWYQNGIGMPFIVYAGMTLTPDMAVAVIDLFFPKFVTHNDTIILHHHFNQETYAEWFQQFDGDLTLVEKFLNTVHVRDLFSNQKFDRHPYQNIEYIGINLKKAWTFELSQHFPDKDIEIIGYYDEPSNDYIIAFWINR